MNRWDAVELARRLMAEHGLAETWSFGFNRAKRTMGICRHDQRRIELSLYFVEANEPAAVHDTLLHEIAHALAGYDAGHGPAWRAVCHRIGAVPKACGHAKMPEGAWQAECPGCGHIYHRHRRPPRGWVYSCPACGPERWALHFKRSERMFGV